MAVSGLLLPSAAGLTVPGRVFRQSLGAMFRPAAANGSLPTVSGVLTGPDNTMGELTLLSDLLVRVQPFVAVIQGTQSTKQGVYTVPNDELVDLGIPVKDASQARKAYIAVRVADSVEAGVASSAATDGAWLELQSGALAASNPALPAQTPNTLYLGELLIPSVASGQPVTVTKYNPRTTMRGGVQSVLVDGLAYPGHDGAAPTFDGQVRWHPTYGIQAGRAGAWGPQRQGLGQRVVKNGSQAITAGVWTVLSWDGPDLNTSPNSPGMWGAGTAGIASLTAPVRGIYATSLNCVGATNQQIRMNSAGVALQGFQLATINNGPAASVEQCHCSGFLMNPGDYITAFVWNATAVSVGTLSGYLAFFNLTLIDPL